MKTMRILIDGGHFFARQGALSFVSLPDLRESAAQPTAATAPPLRVGGQMSPFGVAQRSFGVTRLRLAPTALPVVDRALLDANAGRAHLDLDYRP